MKILRRETQYEEKVSMSGRIFSWRRLWLTIVHLECGHTKTFRGEYVPSHQTRCSVCEGKGGR